MAISLEKGQRISLEKNDGTSLAQFCVGCNWGAIETSSSSFFGLVKNKEVVDVDLDLSCIMTDDHGTLLDHLYSPLYRESFLKHYGLPRGKVDSKDGAMHHSGDDLTGDTSGNDGLDNEIITVNLSKVASDISQIFFFLNNFGKEDFSQIPYAAIRMYEGTPTVVRSIFAEYNVAALPQFQGKRALIMGKLYRRGQAWKFAAIGEAYADENLCVTIARIVRDYAKSSQ